MMYYPSHHFNTTYLIIFVYFILNFYALFSHNSNVHIMVFLITYIIVIESRFCHQNAKVQIVAQIVV